MPKNVVVTSQHPGCGGRSLSFPAKQNHLEVQGGHSPNGHSEKIDNLSRDL